MDAIDCVRGRTALIFTFIFIFLNACMSLVSIIPNKNKICVLILFSDKLRIWKSVA
jgi:hypothetical protein